MDLRKHAKQRQKWQVEFVLRHPDVDEKELAEKARLKGIFSKHVGLTSVRQSIARIRQRQKWIDEGKVPPAIDPHAEEIARIAREEPPMVMQKKLRRKALRVIAACLEAYGWRVTKDAGSEPSYWQDPVGAGIHRLEVAFLVTITREIERSKIIKQATTKRRVRACDPQPPGQEA